MEISLNFGGILCILYIVNRLTKDNAERQLFQERFMSNGNEINNLLHKIRVKLYPNYLPSSEGAYIAKTDNEATISIEQVCGALKKRGGYSGDYNVLVDCVKKYYDEVAYQLCDGYAVNNGYYSIYPNIGGTFNSVNDSYDSKKNPINFKFRTGRLLRNLAQDIGVIIHSVVDGNAYIHEFVDNFEDSVNSLFVPGDVFTIYGNKIKVAGDDPSVGVFLVPVEDPSKAVRVRRLVENFPSKIIGVAQDTEYQYNRIEIRTQFSGSKSNLLKKPRIITSSFVIEAA